MKNTALIVTLLCTATLSFAQSTEKETKEKSASSDTTKNWKIGGTMGVNLTQVSLTNWAAGGQNSISANGLFSVFANYAKGKVSWENRLDLGYGTNKQGKNASWWKTDDKIDFTSKYGQKASEKWHYTGLLNFRTQLAPGFNYPDDSTKISDFLAPGYVIGALGMDYKPNAHFTAFISPLTSKTTIVNSQVLADAGAFGVAPATVDGLGNILTPGENVRNEFGGYLRLFYKRDVMENINLESKLDLYSNYLDNPGNIDVNWEVLIAMKVNKYISATISTQLLYDDDIDIAIDSNDDGITDASGPRVQFKEVLGVGLLYKF